MIKPLHAMTAAEIDDYLHLLNATMRSAVADGVKFTVSVWEDDLNVLSQTTSSRIPVDEAAAQRCLDSIAEPTPS